jgi:transcriptional regulator with XRE-family HTH domain
MGLNIGSVILAKRKQAGITQQQLADFMDVSKASVSKWETGQSYPDITLIPLLASYFDISIDQLMDYTVQLDDQEVRVIYQELQAGFEEQSGEVMLKRINDYLHRYYSCASLVLALGQLIINHMDMLPGENQSSKIETYVEKAKSLFQHVKKITSNANFIDKATKLEAYCLIMQNRPDEVLVLLGKHSPEYIPSESLIAVAYQQKQDLPSAITTSQSGIYQQVAVLLSQLTNYFQLLQKPALLDATFMRGNALIEAFDLERLNRINVLNFLISAATCYARIQQTEVVHGCLTRCIKILKHVTTPLNLHGDQYFDQIDDWLKQTTIGDVVPRNPKHLNRDLIISIENNTFLKPYLKQAEFKDVCQQLKQIKEESNHA